MSPHTIIETLADGFREEGDEVFERGTKQSVPENAQEIFERAAILNDFEKALRRAAEKLKPKEPVDDYDAALAAMHEQQCAKETL